MSEQANAIRPDDYDLTLSYQTAVYPGECISMACCSFLDRAFFMLNTQDAPKRISVSFKMRPDLEENDGGMDRLIYDYHNELVRQANRLRCQKANREIRKYIIGRALESAKYESKGPEPAADVTQDTGRRGDESSHAR